MKTAVILVALIAGLMHIAHEIYQFIRAVLSGSFAITIYYNRSGEAWLDAICFAMFLVIAILGLIFYIPEFKKKL